MSEIIKNVFITGTSSGVGHELTQSFLDRGHNVFGISRKDINFGNSNYTHFPVDLRDIDKIKKEINALDIKFDVVIHNASEFYLSNLMQTDDEIINSIIDTNIKGTIFLTKYLIPKLNKNSRMIFINSVAGKNELPQQSIYCSSKHAISAFANIINEELKDHGIKVTSIYPGGIDTPLWNPSNPYPGSDKDRLLTSNDICKIVHFILNQSDNICLKSLLLYPDNESH